MAGDFKRVRVDLPPSVAAIVLAAGGDKHMPMAMARIVGALPWIARVLFDALPEDEYRAFAGQLRMNTDIALRIAESDDVESAFVAVFERQTREKAAVN